MAEIIGSMQPASNNRLHELCEKHGVSADVELRLGWQVEDLQTWKAEILPDAPTTGERAKALQRIADLAADLKREIESLDFHDRWALDDAYFGVDDHGMPIGLEDGVDSSSFDLGNRIVPSIERAAKEVHQRLKSSGVRGRRAVTPDQADHIRCIAQTLSRSGIEPSFSDPFRDLCEAVFEAAGVTFPERALKHFMKEIRPALREAGYCL